MMAFALVGVGGALGSMARYAISLSAAKLFGVRFPYGTFFVNVTGAFLIAIVLTLFGQRMVAHSETARLGLAVGFLGGYTTFSTYAMETNALAERGEWLLAAANALGSLAAGLIALRLGIVLARMIS